MINFFTDDSVETLIEGEKYQIKFKSGPNKITLLIELDPEFPYNTPGSLTLSVTPNLIHPWIENENKIVKAPGILNVSHRFPVKTLIAHKLIILVHHKLRSWKSVPSNHSRVRKKSC